MSKFLVLWMCDVLIRIASSKVFSDLWFLIIFVLFIIFLCVLLLHPAFNVGDYRRKAATNYRSAAEFFDPKNTEAVKIRELVLCHFYLRFSFINYQKDPMLYNPRAVYCEGAGTFISHMTSLSRDCCHVTTMTVTCLCTNGRYRKLPSYQCDQMQNCKAIYFCHEVQTFLNVERRVLF